MFRSFPLTVTVTAIVKRNNNGPYKIHCQDSICKGEGLKVCLATCKTVSINCMDFSLSHQKSSFAVDAHLYRMLAFNPPPPPQGLGLQYIFPSVLGMCWSCTAMNHVADKGSSSLNRAYRHTYFAALNFLCMGIDAFS